MTVKKFTPPLKIDSEFSHCALYDVKQKAQLELCASLAIEFLISNFSMRWRCSFKGLSQDEWAKVAKKPPRPSLNKCLLKETFCSQIYLAGQTL
jgi:hypothetical protein